MARTSTSGAGTKPLNMEIHLKDGLCKVVEGEGKRTFFSTEEAVGLFLLKHNPESAIAQVNWQDFLRSKGLAFAMQGIKALTLLVTPAQTKTITYGPSGSVHEAVVKVPAMLWASKLQGTVLVRSSIWCIKPGFEPQLSVESTDPCLAAWPYGNVYNHGGVCWGTTNTREIRQATEIEDLFFGSVFNGDLSYITNCGVAEHSLSTLLTRLGKKDAVLPSPTNYPQNVAQVTKDLLR